jgi:hypothetical protein
MNYFNSSIYNALQKESDSLRVILVHPTKVSEAIKAVSACSPSGTKFVDGAWMDPNGQRTIVASYDDKAPSEPFSLTVCNDGVPAIQGEFEHWIQRKKSRS